MGYTQWNNEGNMVMKFKITWSQNDITEFTLEDIVTKDYYRALVKIAIDSKKEITIISEK